MDREILPYPDRPGQLNILLAAGNYESSGRQKYLSDLGAAHATERNSQQCERPGCIDRFRKSNCIVMQRLAFRRCFPGNKMQFTPGKIEVLKQTVINTHPRYAINIDHPFKNLFL